MYSMAPIESGLLTRSSRSGVAVQTQHFAIGTVVLHEVNDALRVRLAVHAEAIAAGTRVGQRCRGLGQFLPCFRWRIRIESGLLEVVEAVIERVSAGIGRRMRPSPSVPACSDRNE